MKQNAWRHAVAAAIAVAVLALPLRVRAETDDSAAADGSALSKFFDLAGCAVGIATISSGVGVVLAGIACGKAAAEWWTT
jgi:hypothetical protein